MRYIYRQVNGRKHKAGTKCIIISPIVIANRYKIDPEIFQIHIVNIEMIRQEYISFDTLHHQPSSPASGFIVWVFVMKEVICVDFRLVEVMVVKVSWFLKVILNCSVRVSVTTVFLKVNKYILEYATEFWQGYRNNAMLGIPAWHKIFQLSKKVTFPLMMFS